MALVYLYKPLESDGETFTTNQVKITRLASSISFVEKLNEVGSFEFMVPTSDSFTNYLEENYIISIDNRYFGIIRQFKQVEDNQEYVWVAGEDLKGILGQRITLYPSTPITQGAQGYDAINNASTEAIVKYFINNNAINSTNPKRKIPRLANAPNQNRGKANDQYMSRFELLPDVCFKNLDGQNMGYKITPDFSNNTLVFDVIQGVNRTAGQYENPRIIFDVKFKNLLSYEYYLSNANYRNVFYASLSGSKSLSETPTAMYYRNGETEAEGIKRREQQLNVSVNVEVEDLYNQLKEYALKDAAQYEKVETLTAVATNRYEYGKDYNLGDFVTVQARKGIFKQKLISMDTQITNITHRWGLRGVQRELGFGKEKISKLDVLKQYVRNGGI